MYEIASDGKLSAFSWYDERQEGLNRKTTEEFVVVTQLRGGSAITC